MKKNWRIIVIAILAFGLCGGEAGAQNGQARLPFDSDGGQARWKSLSSEQRQRIMANYQKFKELPEEKQEKILRRWKEFKNLDDLRRNEIREKFETQWRQKSKHDQKQIVDNYERFQRKPAEEQRRFRDMSKQWQEKPYAQRHSLKEKYRHFRQMTPAERARLPEERVRRWEEKEKQDQFATEEYRKKLRTDGERQREFQDRKSRHIDNIRPRPDRGTGERMMSEPKRPVQYEPRPLPRTTRPSHDLPRNHSR